MALNTDKPATSPQPAPEVQGQSPEMENQAVDSQAPDQPEPAPELTFNAHPKSVSELRQAKSDLLKLKGALLASAKADLSQAADWRREGTANGNAAQVFEESAALTLYKLRTAKIVDDQGNALIAMSGNELTATLGDAYGFKLKPDGKPGKTPAKEGESLRKRVVRLVSAQEAIDAMDNGNPEAIPDYFKGVPLEDVSAVLSRVTAKALSPWSAYDKIGEIVKDSRTPTKWFETASRVESLATDIATADPAILNRIKGNNTLKAALADMVDIIKAAIDY